MYLHSAVDGFTRMAFTEPLSDERSVTAVGFMLRARVWFAAHGISHIEKIVTDNGACYRAEAFATKEGQQTPVGSVTESTAVETEVVDGIGTLPK